MKKFNTVIVTGLMLTMVAPALVLAYGGGSVGQFAGSGSGGSDGPLQAPSIFTVFSDEDGGDDEGEVKGLETFKFNFNMSRFTNVRHPDVTELQARLIDEGVYDGPVTGFFGPLTHAAAVRYQVAQSISPTNGYVGPITRGVLNEDSAGNGAGQTASVSTGLSVEAREGIQTQIDGLLELVKDLMEQLKNL